MAAVNKMYKCELCRKVSARGEPQALIYKYQEAGTNGYNILGIKKVCFQCFWKNQEKEKREKSKK